MRADADRLNPPLRSFYAFRPLTGAWHSAPRGRRLCHARRARKLPAIIGPPTIAALRHRRATRMPSFEPCFNVSTSRARPVSTTLLCARRPRQCRRPRPQPAGSGQSRRFTLAVQSVCIAVIWAKHANVHPPAAVLIQCDESIMAIIRDIDKDRNDFIIEDLDDETCLIKENKLPELKQRLKEVTRTVCTVARPIGIDTPCLAHQRDRP